MTEIQGVPCSHCHAINLPLDVLCQNCGKPVRAATEKTVVMPAATEKTVAMPIELDKTVAIPTSMDKTVAIRSPMDKTVMMSAPKQGLNGRQKAFLWRYILPIAVFVPLYCLLVFLLKMPSTSVVDWLVKPLYRPSPGALARRPLPGWALVAIIDGVITAGIVRLIKPPTWEDLVETR